MKFPKKLIEVLARDYARAYFRGRTQRALMTRFENEVTNLARRIYEKEYIQPLERADRKEERKMAKKNTKKTAKKVVKKTK